MDNIQTKLNIYKENLLDNLAHSSINENIHNKVIDNLIENIMENKIIHNSNFLKFPNIKTELYPYQINNVNWMNDIENKNYDDNFENISKNTDLKGGALFDEVGMGKTLQIITLINLNKSKFTDKLIYKNKLYTKATLIIVPNHLCGQWLREFEKHTIKSLNILNLLTKSHYKKYTHLDYTNVDVVIISSNYFINCDLKLSDRNIFNFEKDILKKEVNIFNIYWNRVVIDEYHEYENESLFYKLNYLEASYRWILSGTPFKKNSEDLNINKELSKKTRLKKNKLIPLSFFTSSPIEKILGYLAFNNSILSNINLYDLNNYNFVLNHFSRNTQNNNLKILKLPEIEEEIVMLNFSQTERMIYNSYLTDKNNNDDDIFLRQICCHPSLADDLNKNDDTNSFLSLDGMHQNIKNKYLKEYENLKEKLNRNKQNYKNVQNKIEEYEEEFKEKNLESITNKIKERKERLQELKIEEQTIIKQISSKESSIKYCINFMEIIKNVDSITNQDCPICLGNIEEDDIGITSCLHLFCYSCIKQMIMTQKKYGNTKCPNCKISIKINDVFLINKTINKEVNKYGTKISYIIDYIKKSPKKYRIIFSQWDKLLNNVGKILEDSGIKILYCKGTPYQKDKVLKLFSNNNENNEFRIIMLSTEKTASGSNLSNAEEVIFLDPIYGNKERRKNVEIQAIGRVRRLGNNFKKIKVLKLIIKDTIEEKTYKDNQN